MKEIFKKFLLSLSAVAIVSTTVITSTYAMEEQSKVATDNTTEINIESPVVYEDELEQRIDRAYIAYYKELRKQEDEVTTQSSLVRKLVELIFKRPAYATKVTATPKNISTNLTMHAMQEALADGITSLMVDNVLSGKPSGMWAIAHFDDIREGKGLSRIAVDPNNKVVVILARDSNTILTIYKDSGNSIINRSDDTKWRSSNWKFR
ncbi:hypothetical protein [Paenibacillus amylolyticus]|uniref:Uncharacterized protein n=1 Tax=Paenibacillus amylolyticus TaxID=1451 RepID=A0A100VQP9_PAEAM|nr:hypothetical protein [Paenibacillus amylolyticus]GAS84265.1 unknown protein [Paenibacillus amylolyticus]